MNPSIKKGYGTSYKIMHLYKNGRYYTKAVHRILAELFVPNPNNYPVVNHKDENGLNNDIDNLEWCTIKYNSTYGTAIDRRATKQRGVPHSDKHKEQISKSMYRYYSSKNSPSRRVMCIENGVIYQGVKAAAKELNVSEGTVRMSCKRQTGKGRRYTFRYYPSLREEYLSARMDEGSENGG